MSLEFRRARELLVALVAVYVAIAIVDIEHSESVIVLRSRGSSSVAEGTVADKLRGGV
jgi:hypothetical protein